MTIETSVPTHAPHLVIGAGLQGAAIALELAHRGHDVLLLEQDARPMNRASLRNEGKIHLGLIYAGDQSGQTAHMQLNGALRFGGLMQRWIGPRWSMIRRSTPFIYLVARDSLLDCDQLEAHYGRLQREYAQALAADASLDYLGLNPTWLAQRRPLETLAGNFDLARLAGAFDTCELAIDTDDLAMQVTQALHAHPRVRLVCNARVAALEERGDGWEVALHTPSGGRATRVRADFLFNATWDQRIGLDRLAGLEPDPGWLHRLKYRVIARIPAHAATRPSATMVLGPYGDVVIRGTTAYFSWYPSGLRGWSHDLRPPESWNAVTRDFASGPEHLAIGQEILQKTIDWYPALAGSALLTVDAGAIFAFGDSDVDQSDSGLHGRARIGVRSRGRYFSVDPGKLTTAPVQAIRAVDLALGSNGALR